MSDTETLSMMTIVATGRIGAADTLNLCRHAGGAAAAIEARRHIAGTPADPKGKIAKALTDLDEAKRKAETELEACVRRGITVVTHGQEGYPSRLAECDDAPPVIFYKGTDSLDARRVISVVGTRHCTAYGQDMTRRLVADLGTVCPDTLIVSGLAYGIDISAHRQALDSGLDTVAVLAHGLDRLYPPAHRETATRMITQGGLLTEFMTGTVPDKVNFLRRNRLVAGLSDAIVVVESAAKGGGLATARLANGYNRDVFAFPGRSGDTYSEGCNNLIRDNKAALITGADDLLAAMGWTDGGRTTRGGATAVERTLFPELTPEECAVTDALDSNNDRHLNTLAATLGKPVSQLTATLFSLEMKGVVRCLAGGVWHLIK